MAKPSIYVKAEHCVHCAADHLLPIRGVDAIEISKLPREKPYRARLTRPRNTKVHSLYFSAIAAAAKHWPEGVYPNPQGDADFLRAYLQCEVDWCERMDGPASAKDLIIWTIKRVSGEGRFAFVREIILPSGEAGLNVRVPMSVDWDTLDEDEFAPVKTKVFGIIESVLQCTVKQLVEADENET